MKQKRKHPIHWFTPQIHTKTCAWPGPRLGPRVWTRCRLLTELTGMQSLTCHHCLPGSALAGRRSWKCRIAAPWPPGSSHYAKQNWGPAKSVQFNSIDAESPIWENHAHHRQLKHFPCIFALALWIVFHSVIQDLFEMDVFSMKTNYAVIKNQKYQRSMVVYIMFASICVVSLSPWNLLKWNTRLRHQDQRQYLLIHPVLKKKSTPPASLLQSNTKMTIPWPTQM